MDAFEKAYNDAVNKELLIRRFNLTAEDVLPKSEVDEFLEEDDFKAPEQMDIFTNYKLVEELKKQEDEKLQMEHEIQRVVLMVKKKFGKNSILRGMNLKEGATAKDRNAQIGGHKA